MIDILFYCRSCIQCIGVHIHKPISKDFGCLVVNDFGIKGTSCQFSVSLTFTSGLAVEQVIIPNFDIGSIISLI